MTGKKAYKQTKELFTTLTPEEIREFTQFAVKRAVELAIEKAAREFVYKMIEWEYGLVGEQQSTDKNPPNNSLLNH